MGGSVIPASSLDTSASNAGFGPLTAAVRHPNGRLYAVMYWLWAVPLGAIPIVAVVSLVAGRGNVQLSGIVIGLLCGAAAALLASRALGSVRKRAFYLYPQGYIATSASGKVTHVKTWAEVSRIDGAGPGVRLVAMNRTMCAIHHHRGRPVKFSEPLGRELLATRLHELHAGAVGPTQ